MDKELALILNVTMPFHVGHLPGLCESLTSRFGDI